MPVDRTLHVVAVATDAADPHLGFYRRSFGPGLGPPTILGLGEVWTGFDFKIRSVADHCRALAARSPDAYVVMTDAYDVLVNGRGVTSADVLAAFDACVATGPYRVVVGAERACGPNCHRPAGSVTARRVADTHLRYPNTGFVMGKASDVAALFDRMYSLFPSDDQYAAGLVLAHDGLDGVVCLDTGSTLVHNWWPADPLVWDPGTARFRSGETSPVFIHTPFNPGDNGKRSAACVNHLLPATDPGETRPTTTVVQHIMRVAWNPVYVQIWAPAIVAASSAIAIGILVHQLIRCRATHPREPQRPP
jgi:hypothetical protein